MKKILLSCAFIALSAASAWAINVGGGLSDWGLTSVDGYSTADSVGSSVTGVQGDTYYWEEKGYTRQGYVEPGWGGKKFDIAGLYAKRNGNKLYVASILGTPKSGALGEKLGDLWIGKGSWDSSDYAIETLGSYAGAIKTGGYPSDTTFSSSMPDNMIGGSIAGAAEFIYEEFMDGYYYIEAALELPADLWGEALKIHLTQTCGNDVADLYLPAPVPEPAAILLLALGLFGLRAAKRLRR